MGIFSRKKEEGEKLAPWGYQYKCEKCNHDRFIHVKFYEGKRYDSYYADCAKCGEHLGIDGPFHPEYRS